MGLTHRYVDRRGNCNRVRIAAQPLGVRPHFTADLFSLLNTGQNREDHFAPLDRKLASASALPRLDDNRVALWRLRHRERALVLEPVASVFGPMDFRGIGKDTIRFVELNSARLPRIPHIDDILH